MKKVGFLGILAIMMAALTLAQPSSASACGCGGQKGEQAACANKQCGGDKAAINAALEAKDFAAWQKAIAGASCPMKLEATQANFDQLVKIHELKKSGQWEEAKQLQEQLGLPAKGGCGCGAKVNLQGQGVDKPQAKAKPNFLAKLAFWNR